MKMTSASCLAAGMAIAALYGCGDSGYAGGTSETESALSRSIRVDSLPTESGGTDTTPTVAVLRLDSGSIPFERTSPTGRDVSVERFDGPILPFRVVYWDKPARRGRIEVRLDPWLREKGTRFLLRWGLTDSVRADSVKVWRAIPDTQRLSMTSVLVDDFEHGTLQSPLSSTSVWSATAGDTATVTSFGVTAAGHGRGGKALFLSFTNKKGYVFTNVPLANGPRSLRSLDSIVLWARCDTTGKVGVSFDRTTPSGKSWTFVKIDTGWTRIRIRPQDLDPVNNIGGNVGWEAVRDQITHLTFFPQGGSQLWIDDIRLHGVTKNDLK